MTDSQLVLRGRGGIETAIVTFTVSNVSSEPISGVRVNFELSTSVGGVRFIGSESVVSDSSGLASVIVQSGTFPVAVLVSATIDQTDTRAVSNEIAVSTSSFSASSFPLFALVDDLDDAGEVILSGITVGLQIIATDQFGHKVLDGSRVTFVSPETGLIEPSTCELEAGICSATFTTTDASLGSGGNFDATVIAYASGAEAFSDTNSNNVYELGEPFVDLGEAFADENNNGSYDMGEFFVDAEDLSGVKNGVYDAAGNGVWDGPCISIEGESATDRAARCAGANSTIISDTYNLLLNTNSPSS